MIQVGIIGSSGYVAGEVIRCLIHHPKVNLNFLFSHSNAGKKVAQIHQDLLNESELVFIDKINPDVDVVFLCLGHGNSTTFLQNNDFSASTKIIDLSNDFRLKEDAVFDHKTFVYGLIEMNKAEIKKANYIANPGCFATAIQLGLLPLASNGLLSKDIHVNAITGSTGAGQTLSNTSHFSWRNNNISIYKAFEHQHLGEITESLSTVQKSFTSDVNFLPVRGDFTRGIFASMYTACELSESELIGLYKEYYKNEAFTHVSDSSVDLKQVVNTNQCFIQIQKIKGKVLITSVIDNLLKGAAGQAIQNMNLLFGLDETVGLNFKANYY